MFENLGEKVSESDVLAMLEYADKDKDGYLNYEEFSTIIRSVWMIIFTIYTYTYELQR